MHIPASSHASVFLSRLEARLRRPSLRLAYSQGRKNKTSGSSPSAKVGSVAVDVAPGVSRGSGGKANGDRLSWCIRDCASAAAKKGVSTAASALCQALVELDKILATAVETGSSVKHAAADTAAEKTEQLHALVSLFDVVSRGVFLCVEGTTTTSSAGDRYDRSLDTLRGLVVRAKELAARLRSKSRLGVLSRKHKHHLHAQLGRDLEALSDAVYRFAASHKPELATDERHYVSKSRAKSPPFADESGGWHAKLSEYSDIVVFFLLLFCFARSAGSLLANGATLGAWLAPAQHLRARGCSRVAPRGREVQLRGAIPPVGSGGFGDRSPIPEDT